MKKYLKNLFALIILSVLFLPVLVLASPAYDNLVTTGSSGNGPFQAANETKMASIVGIVINTFLGILGVLFLAYILYAGYNWMTAQGDEEKVTKAKDTIQRAVIGVIVCIAAYAITYFVFQNLVFNGGILR